ncbi:hypothetical protein HerbRD11066_66730 [Herbidospora sp. RD11066]
MGILPILIQAFIDKRHKTQADVSDTAKDAAIPGIWLAVAFGTLEFLVVAFVIAYTHFGGQALVRDSPLRTVVLLLSAGTAWMGVHGSWVAITRDHDTASLGIFGALMATGSLIAVSAI